VPCRLSTLAHSKSFNEHKEELINFWIHWASVIHPRSRLIFSNILMELMIWTSLIPLKSPISLTTEAHHENVNILSTGKAIPVNMTPGNLKRTFMTRSASSIIGRKPQDPQLTTTIHASLRTVFSLFLSERE